MVGLIKTILVLKHRLVPGQLHLDRQNPLIELGGTRWELARGQVHLPTGRDLLAGVSSFGFGGSNADFRGRGLG
jgi:acyl transferase domain-containing protein